MFYYDPRGFSKILLIQVNTMLLHGYTHFGSFVPLSHFTCFVLGNTTI